MARIRIGLKVIELYAMNESNLSTLYSILASLLLSCQGIVCFYSISISILKYMTFNIVVLCMYLLHSDIFNDCLLKLTITQVYYLLTLKSSHNQKLQNYNVTQSKEIDSLCSNALSFSSVNKTGNCRQHPQSVVPKLV